jgi:hypothetical protein
MEDLSKGYEPPAVFSLLLVRMIMRLRLLVRGVDRPGLKLEPEQLGRLVTWHTSAGPGSSSRAGKESGCTTESPLRPIHTPSAF